jgi:hypothetical protein
MTRENDTLKTVTALLGVGVVGFLGYKYFADKSEQETIKSKLQGVIIDANNSGKSILPTVKDVVKDLKTNPASQTYTVGEYKQMADSLYQYIITGNGGGIIKIFGQMKTNQDVKLLNIYFAVRVYKQDDWYGEFKVNTWNLAQFMSSDLVSGTVRGLLTKLFKQKNITYKIW